MKKDVELIRLRMLDFKYHIEYSRNICLEKNRVRNVWCMRERDPQIGVAEID